MNAGQDCGRRSRKTEPKSLMGTSSCKQSAGMDENEHKKGYEDKDEDEDEDEEDQETGGRGRGGGGAGRG